MPAMVLCWCWLSVQFSRPFHGDDGNASNGVVTGAGAQCLFLVFFMNNDANNGVVLVLALSTIFSASSR